MFARKSLFAAAALVAFGASTTVMAATSPATTTFTVQLTVQKACSVSASGTNVNLGTVDAGTANPTGNSTFTVSCSNTTPFNIGLVPGAGGTAGTGNLSGTATGNTGTKIAYALFSDSLNSVAWGNVSGAGGNQVGGTGTGMSNAITKTVYAKATGSTDVVPDTYKDTVTINVNF